MPWRCFLKEPKQNSRKGKKGRAIRACELNLRRLGEDVQTDDLDVSIFSVETSLLM
jgi:hypothetical protein